MEGKNEEVERSKGRVKKEEEAIQWSYDYHWKKILIRNDALFQKTQF